MIIVPNTITKSLNKAYLKQDVTKNEIERFKYALTNFFKSINYDESEEYQKNTISDFLKNAIYNNKNLINTKGRIDLAIYNGLTVNDTVGVLIEVKSTSNKNEMISIAKSNVKALQEAISYYLEQTVTLHNEDLKHIIITNTDEWFIFDGAEFDRAFYKNTGLAEKFTHHRGGLFGAHTTDYFYNYLRDEIITKLGEFNCTYFNINYFKDKINDSAKIDEIIALYKILSPEHLLKKPFVNDSNNLDTQFYDELLHLLGLEETKDGGKKVLSRLPEERRNEGSFLENTIQTLKVNNSLSRIANINEFGQTEDKQYFSVGLELCITWLNRILFMKLLESQLIKYHNNDYNYKFLSNNKVSDFDDLNELFFEVLAVKVENRTKTVLERYANIPYLNSSLFEMTELEQNTINISSLKDRHLLPISSKSVLKSINGEKITGKLKFHYYLFEFLDSYNFSSDSKAIIQETEKTIINSSVLGLIFEKLNGYKDGSIYTPGFITMYMCREAIQKAVVQKFQEALKTSSPNPFSKLEKGNKSTQKSDLNSPLHSWRGAGGEVLKSGKEVLSVVQTHLPKTLLDNARYLRKNQTKAESYLWELLRNRQLDGFKFRRQHPIVTHIIFDFFCVDARLAIELDGADHDIKDQKEYDEERSKVAAIYGIKVLRFNNSAIFEDIEKVLNLIYLECQQRVIKDLDVIEEENNVMIPETYDDLKNLISGLIKKEDLLWANSVINSIRLIDPAVGSGHFLVSALNEFLYIKSQLGILIDKKGKKLNDYKFYIENDELIVIDNDDEENNTKEDKIFHYLSPFNVSGAKRDKLQRVQETLFHEKQTIIENCLFGVDINPKSVAIARLRLWIELLKSAYYKKENLTQTLSKVGEGFKSDEKSSLNYPLHSGIEDDDKTSNLNNFSKLEKGNKATQKSDLNYPLHSWRGAGGEVLNAGGEVLNAGGEVWELETLPNIDINIKCGNSLVSRFSLDDKSITRGDAKIIPLYKNAVQKYKNIKNSADKRKVILEIENYKTQLKGLFILTSNKMFQLSNKQEELKSFIGQQDLFHESKTKKQQIEFAKTVERLTAEIEKLRKEVDDIKNNPVYQNAFEWRFEFPEVLDDEGNFIGFDLVIGNPPYIGIRTSQISQELSSFYKMKYFLSSGQYDLFCLFIELSNNLLKQSGKFAFIVSKRVVSNENFENVREFLISKMGLYAYFDTEMPFESVNVESNIICCDKVSKAKYISNYKIEQIHKVSFIEYCKIDIDLIEKLPFKIFPFLIDFEAIKLVKDIFEKNNLIEFGKIANITRGFEFGFNHNSISKIPKGKKILKGENVSKYNIVESDFYIEPDFSDSKSFKKEEIFSTIPKLLSRFVSNNLVFAIDDKIGYYNTNVVYNIQIVDINYNIKYLLALLNSSLLNYWFFNVYSNTDKIFPHIQKNQLASIVINVANAEQQQPFIDLVDIILEKKENNEDTSKEEKEIDMMVYKLYDLTEEEIKIVEGRE
jgi:very-short-patch-repair endonuclease